MSKKNLKFVQVSKNGIRWVSGKLPKSMLRASYVADSIQRGK